MTLPVPSRLGQQLGLFMAVSILHRRFNSLSHVAADGRSEYHAANGLVWIVYCLKSEEASGMTCSKGSGLIESCPMKGRS